jgi:hypothetical protein
VAEGKVAASVAGSIANLSQDQQRVLAESFIQTGKLSATDVAEVRRVEREEQLAGLGEALLALDGRPEPVEVFKQAIRQALSAGLEPDELLAVVREIAVASAGLSRSPERSEGEAKEVADGRSQG